MTETPLRDHPGAVAIIGMAGRFPGASSLAEFWHLLLRGQEAITRFSDRELLEAGVSPALLRSPDYVKAAPTLADIQGFDAPFFELSPREAATIDPQQRLFLECAWEALEDGGYVAERFAGAVGVYAGAGGSMTSYLLSEQHLNDTLLGPTGSLQHIGNDKDFLCTRVSYKLSLRGPSLTVQTACSSSLVAVHLACQSLLSGECDMALAGGVTVRVPHSSGYLYQRGGIFSPDGHCRPFDAAAEGTVFGSGAGVVLLKPLARALADRDQIYAVIRGSAVNNDGAAKFSYAASSAQGQAAVVAEALAVAEVSAATVSYVEAHGTATAIGDPIEIQALTQVFGAASQRRQFCAVGSVKGNIGHLEAAAGVVGLIKTALALHHGQLPASLHCANPNPRIDFPSTPFYVNTELRAWPRGEQPRRAGVSSFGIGGTNAHAVLEEAPAPEPAAAGQDRPLHLLTLSARTPAALLELVRRYERHLSAQPAPALADVCFTAAQGRTHFRHRLALTAADSAEARTLLGQALAGGEPTKIVQGQADTAPKIAFLCTGQGAQYVGMGRELYQTQPVFRAAVDRCARLLFADLGTDIRPIMFGADGTVSGADEGRRTEDEGAFLGEQTHGPGKAAAGEQEPRIDIDIDEGRRTEDEGAFLGEQTHGPGKAAAGEQEPRIDIDRATGVEDADLRPSSSGLGPSRDTDLRPSSSGLGPSGDADLRPSSSGLGPASELDQTQYTQPALFVLEYALAQLWRAWGVRPDVLIGHSVGEYVAACLAGVLSLEDGLKLIAARGRLVQALPPGGAMAAVFTDEATLRGLLAPQDGPLDIAAVNNPGEVVISGAAAAVARASARLQEAGLRVQALAVSHAFHSALLEPALDAFEQIVARMRLSPPQIPLVSNLTGALADAAEITQPGYWRRHLRETVRFAEGMRALQALGVDVCLEIGPGATLLGMGRRCLPNQPVAWLPSLRKGRSDWRQLLGSLAALHVRGAAVNWAGFEGRAARRRVSLPTYPFERVRCWTEPRALPAAGLDDEGLALGLPPLLGRPLRTPLDEQIFEARFSTAALPLLEDHRIFEAVLVAGASYLSMVLSAAEELIGGGRYCLEDVSFLQALVIPEGDTRVVQLLLRPQDDQRYRFEVFSRTPRAGGRAAWTRHAQGLLGPADPVAAAPFDPGQQRMLLARCPDERSGDQFYVDFYRTRAIKLGPQFQWISRIHSGQGEALCRMRAIPAGESALLPPGLIDACVQLIIDRLPEQTFVPIGVQRMVVLGRPEGELIGATALDEPHGQGDLCSGEVRLFDERGRPLVLLEGMQLRRAPREALLRTLAEQHDDWIYQIEWAAWAPARPAVTPRQWLILADPHGVGAALAATLTARGETCRVVEHTPTADPAALAALLAEPLRAAGTARTEVVSLWALAQTEAPDADGEALLDTYQDCCGGALALVQALASAEQPARLHLITRGSRAVCGPPETVAGAGLWGLGRVVAREHPEIWGGLIDLDPAAAPEECARGLGEIWLFEPEDSLALRGGQIWVERLARRPRPAEPPAPFRPRPDASYLITGGLGGLGLLTARRLVERGARALVLVGRRAPDQRAAEALRALEAAGARVLVAQADVARRADLTALLERAARELPPLRGVFHAAGVLDDGVLLQQRPERFARAAAPKLQGAWNLHRLTRDTPLDCFVLFSSVAGLLGNPGQANYAAANAALDGLAALRRAAGLPALSIAWGTWAEVGMAAGVEHQKALAAMRGLIPIAPGEGLDLLERLAGMGDAPAGQIAALAVDWAEFGRALPERLPALTAAWVGQARQHGAGSRAPAQISRAQLLAAAPAQRQTLVEEYLRQQVARTLGIPAEGLDARQPLGQLGLDSLMAIELRQRIGRDTAVDLPIATFLDGQGLGQIGAALRERLEQAQPEPALAGGAPAPDMWEEGEL